MSDTLPTFAVAGDPNVGKSTVVATLAEDDDVEISRRAGTTRKANPYIASIDGRPILKFVDLPGFENTPATAEWFEDHRDAKGDIAARFVAEHHGRKEFQADCEILRSLDHLAVLFVVDSSRPVEQRDRDQAEILRLCTDKRMAIINLKSGGPLTAQDRQILADWKEMLGRNFSCREFDPHRANFNDRIDLLEAISHIIPDWRTPMKSAIDALKEDWKSRLAEATGELMQFITRVMEIKVTVSLRGGENEAQKTAKDKVRDAVRHEEIRLRKNIRRIFRHRRAEWKLPEECLLENDLFSEKVWELFGLNRRQLIGAGTMTGMVVGAGIDLMIGGASMFIGAAIGAAIGAVGGWLAVDKSVDCKMPGMKVPGTPFRIGGGNIQASERLEAMVTPQSNLVWILIDRALLYIGAAANWSHGRRENPEDLTGFGKSGVSASWEDKQRRILIQWIGDMRSKKITRGKSMEHEEAASRFILEQIIRLTGSPLP
jgi:hypothetical protein